MSRASFFTRSAPAAVLLVLPLAAALSAGRSVPTQSVAEGAWTVTYVANEGFLIRTSKGTILCDALFGGFDGRWCDQPDAGTIDRMKAAEGPFRDIDVVTISHAHIDHFDPGIVVAHVLHNPKVRVLCPRQVEDALAQDPAYATIRAKIVAVTPAAGGEETIAVGGVSVRVLRVDHGPYYDEDPKTKERVNRHRNVENLAFVFEAGDVRILHTGDAGPDSAASLLPYGLSRRSPDMALLGRGFAWPAGVEIVRREIAPEVIGYMHIGSAEAPKLRGIIASEKPGAPEVVLFDKPGEVRTFTKKAPPAR